MMNNKKFYDELDQIGLFFNSIIDYEECMFLLEDFYSEYIMSPDEIYDVKKDLLYINSKYDNDKNMYEEFLNKNFYSKFKFDLNDTNDRRLKNLIIPSISVIRDNKTKKRRTIFNYSFTFVKALNLLGVDIRKNALTGNYNSFFKRIKNELNDYLKSFNNFLGGKANKKDYDLIVNKLHIIKDQNNITRRDIIILKNIRDFIKKIKNNISIFSHMVKNEEFNLDEFIRCFDIDKLYLICSKCMLDYANDSYNIAPGSFYTGINEVLNYVTKATDEFNEEYNPSIKCYNKETNEYYTYDFKTLKSKINNYLSLFPNDKIKSLSYEEMKENNISKPKDIMDYLRSKENISALKASWEFIKKGENDTYIKRRKKHNIDKKYVDSESLESKVYDRLEYFEQTNYTAKIVGVDKFNGYIGYIYNDGTVIFEKFFDDMEKKKPAKEGNATYVMNIYNFTEFSKLSKPEIMNYIKNNNDGTILRKYHTKNWKNNINDILRDIRIDIDTQRAINKLIDEGKVK